MATLDIKYLQDKNDTKFFPVTHVNGVIVDTGGTTIQNWLNAQLGTKASQSDVNAISGDVATKASTAITITAGDGLTGGGDLSVNRTISLSMPSYSTASTFTSSTATSNEPIVYRVCKAANGASLNNQVCPINLQNGQQCNVIYMGSTTAATYTVSISTAYKTPTGSALDTFTVPANGYVELNYIKLDDTIFVRGV
jgi:hypothetical protein